MELSREVRRLAVPAIAHSLLQTVVFVVDRLMLGRHGGASLAAMQIGGAFEWSIWSVFAAFEVGTIARVGRHVGADRPDDARRAAGISVVLATVLGLCLTLATPLVLAELPAIAPSVSADAIEESRRYLAMTIAASPFVFLAMTATAILQAGGDTRTPLLIGIFANVVHLGLNRVLILGVAGTLPAMGARGAGISTAITFALQAALALLALLDRKKPVSLRKRVISVPAPARSSADAVVEPRPSLFSPAGRERRETIRGEALALTKIAIPAFFERILYHVGYVGWVLVVVRLGDATMSANQAMISIESICFLSGDGFGIAAAALVAQKLGAGRPEEARQAAWISTRYAVITLTAFGVIAYVLRNVILPQFTPEPEVIGIGLQTFPVLVLAQPFMAVGIVLGQSLRGAGRTREAFGVSLVGAVLVRLTATWMFGIVGGLGLAGVWLGSTTDWIVRTVILGIFWRREAGKLTVRSS